jgi:hypothetical protein
MKGSAAQRGEKEVFRSAGVWAAICVGTLLAWAGCADEELELFEYTEPAPLPLVEQCAAQEIPEEIEFVCALAENNAWYVSECGSVPTDLESCPAGGFLYSQGYCSGFGAASTEALAFVDSTEGSGVGAFLLQVEELRFGRPPLERLDALEAAYTSIGCTASPRQVSVTDVEFQVFDCDGWTGYSEVIIEDGDTRSVWAGAARDSASSCLTGAAR